MNRIKTETEVFLKDDYQFVEHILKAKESTEEIGYIRYLVFGKTPTFLSGLKNEECINFISNNSDFSKRNIYLDGVYLKKEYRTDEQLRKEIIQESVSYIAEHNSNAAIFLFKKKYEPSQDRINCIKNVVFENQTEEVFALLNEELSNMNKEDIDFELPSREDIYLDGQLLEERIKLIEVLEKETQLSHNAITKVVKKVSQLDNKFSLNVKSIRTTDEIILGYGRIRRLQLDIGNECYEFSWDGQHLGKL